MNIEISVIIPVYNMDMYIDEAIRSVLNGDFNDFEVLVIDDGSVDSTQTVVAEYADPSNSKYDVRVKYEYQDNSGKPAAVNLAIESSTGKYITILDADDQLTPNSLSSRYYALENSVRPCYHLAVGEFEVFNLEGCTVGHRPILQASTPDYMYKNFYLSYKSPFHLNACLFSRELYRRVGPFDTRLRRCQDIDYSIRLLKSADRVAWVNESVYRYRKHRSDYVERARG